MTTNTTESGTSVPSVPAASAASPTPASASAPDASATELAALKSILADTAATLLAVVPDNLRGLIPTNLPPAQQIAWFNQAKATGVFDKPAVPATDGGTKPTITPIKPDTSSLPVYARIAAGYRK